MYYKNNLVSFMNVLEAAQEKGNDLFGEGQQGSKGFRRRCLQFRIIDVIGSPQGCDQVIGRGRMVVQRNDGIIKQLGIQHGGSHDDGGTSLK